MNDIKNRLIKSDPAWNDLLSRQNLIGEELVDGAVAGDVAVAGIKKGDNLVSVIDLTNLVDLTSEFTIVSDGVINNTGGTSTDAAKVKVLYEQWIIR
jgi:hypothetical protein